MCGYFKKKTMNELCVVMDSQQRGEYIDRLLKLDGLSHIQEDVLAAYCPLSLTLTPEECKDVIKRRQEILMKEVLEVAGITAYDPGSSPFSPDKNLTAQPNEIYVTDSGKIVGSRFFVGHHLLASTGQGIEVEKAKTYNRIAVILMDKHIRISRMQPHRTIYLQYDNFEKEASSFVPVFELLKQYDPGMGFQGSLPVLVGFPKNGGEAVNLEELVYNEFPQLQYHFDGTVGIAEFQLKNPDIFYENVKKK